MLKNIFIRENFLSNHLLEIFNDFVSTTDLWENNGDGVWNNRSINIRSMPSNIKSLILDYRCSVKSEIQQAFSLDREIFSDIFQFVRWPEGTDLYPPHADAEQQDGSPHPFYYRHFSAITYLNDNYKGGQLYFSKFDNFTPGIKPGTLVIFPTTLEYSHGVTKVIEGMRYTIASFFTFDDKRKDGF